MSQCEFILVRHAQTHANTAHSACGQLDSQLTEQGRQTAQDVSSRFFKNTTTHSTIYHSFLSRSLETAQIFSKCTDSPYLEQLDGLEEQSFGKWEGNSWVKVLSKLKLGATPPGGESRSRYAARVLKALRNVMKKDSDGPIPIIIGHGGTFFSIGYEFGFEVMHIDNCFICKYTFEDNSLTTPPISTKAFNYVVGDFEEKRIYV